MADQCPLFRLSLSFLRLCHIADIYFSLSFLRKKGVYG